LRINSSFGNRVCVLVWQVRVDVYAVIRAKFAQIAPVSAQRMH